MATSTTTQIQMDDPAIMLDELIAQAPRGWLSWHIFATAPDVKQPPPPPPPRKKKSRPGREPKTPKRGTPIKQLQQMFGGNLKPGEKPQKKFWQGSQNLRMFTSGKPTQKFIFDRDDRRQFNIFLAQIEDLRAAIPDVTHISVFWLILEIYFEEDLERDGISLKQNEEALFRAMVAERLKADPLWVPDYAQLAPGFPNLAPMERDGQPNKDRSKLLRLLVSKVRRQLGIPAPPPPQSAASLIAELANEGLSLEQIGAKLKIRGYQVTQSYLKSVFNRLDRETPVTVTPISVPFPPGAKIEIMPSTTPITIEIPPGIRAEAKPAPRALPVQLRPVKALEAKAGPEARARELLRAGKTYQEIQESLQREGYPERLTDEGFNILPPKSLRRLASELRKADTPIPIEQAKSRSDVARALLRQGLDYGQVEETMRQRGESPLSRGQLRAIKSGLKG